MYEENKASLDPWTKSGTSALEQLNSMLAPGGELTKAYPAFTGTNLEMDPGYQVRIEEGQKGVERSSAARTGTLSGAATKEMARYNQDFASNEYSNAYNRSLNAYNTNFDTANTNQTNLFNRLQTLSSMGENAAGQTAGLGANTATQIGQNTMGAANATAAGTVAGANAVGGALTSTASNINQLMMLQQILNQNKSGYVVNSPAAINSYATGEAWV
jgi:asparagine N-glycosylation enzyme membrane subunit Stt3